MSLLLAPVPLYSAKDCIDHATLADILDDNPTLSWRGWWNRYDERTYELSDLARFRDETLEPWGLAQFQRAMAFLEVAPRVKVVTYDRSTYGWKHTVERFHRSRNENKQADVYCGEGSFIAAAIACGMIVKRRDIWTHVNLGRRAHAMGCRL